MLFLQTIITILVLTKSSGPKLHAVASTAPIFARFYVCHTDISGGGSSYSNFPPPTSCPYPAPIQMSLFKTHLSRPWEDLPTDLWAIQPTGHEVTHFKKAASVRVNIFTYAVQGLLHEIFQTLFFYYLVQYRS
jgi:hypothetical protein